MESSGAKPIQTSPSSLTTHATYINTLGSPLPEITRSLNGCTGLKRMRMRKEGEGVRGKVGLWGPNSDPDRI